MKFHRKIIAYSYTLGLMFFILFTSCQDKTKGRSSMVASYVVDQEAVKDIIPGAERIATYHSLIKGKNTALVVNHTSMVGNRHLVDTLLGLGVKVKKVFAPEHGFRGNKSDGEKVDDNIDQSTGLPIISLYGKKKKPIPDDLDGIEVILFDIQDVGARFYTYLSTMHYVMEACAENSIPVIVLDRPNPHVNYVDGPVLEKAHSSFIGLHPVPIIYGMTIGEYAKMINGEQWLKNGIKADLTVVPIKNFTRDDYYQIPIKPSPNLPNETSILLYPSLCFFEGTTISLGRGTDDPFQILGHPEWKNKSYSFTPQPNEGSKYPPQKGKLCFGLDLRKTTTGSIIEAKQLNLSYLLNTYQEFKEMDLPFFLETDHFNKVSGNALLKQQLQDDMNESEIRDSWKEGLIEFKEIRQRYLIYPQ